MVKNKFALSGLMAAMLFGMCAYSIGVYASPGGTETIEQTEKTYGRDPENDPVPVNEKLIGYGYAPELPAPEKSLLPTINTAKAIGWQVGQRPVAASGLEVNSFAAGFDHPRWIYVLPNNDVLVAETNSPAKPDDNKGIKGFATKLIMSGAGAQTESANRITLLRDADNDGVAETRSVFLQGLNSPFGMDLVGDKLYVANTDSVMEFPYKDGDVKITSAGTKIIDLPAGTINHHWTKNLIASLDGKKLYVTVGSNSNVAENGMENEVERAAILEVDLATRTKRIFASGLRNPNGLAWNPDSKKLWTVVNERDELGDNLVPDYMTSVTEGAFYGWPYSYFGQYIDQRAKPLNYERIAKAIQPDYALGAHTASLGLAFNTYDKFPEKYKKGAFIGQHGSWNRKPRSGYKVIYIPFLDGKPNGYPQDILTGFVNDNDEAMGRPVGVTFNRKGGLLVADDVGNVIWRVSPKANGQ